MLYLGYFSHRAHRNKLKLFIITLIMPTSFDIVFMITLIHLIKRIVAVKRTRKIFKKYFLN